MHGLSKPCILSVIKGKAGDTEAFDYHATPYSKGHGNH